MGDTTKDSNENVDSTHPTVDQIKNFIISKLLFRDGYDVVVGDCIMRCSQTEIIEYICDEKLHQSPFGQKFKNVHRNIGRILEGDKTYNKIPANVQSFDDFLLSEPGWNKTPPDCWIFHRDYDCFVQRGRRGTIVQRSQMSMNCFVQAPGSIRKDLESMYSAEPIGMVDMAKFISEHMLKDSLEKLIMDRGGSSRDLLEDLTQPGTIISSARPKDIPELLPEFGVCLVAGFRVSDEFQKSDIFSHKHLLENEQPDRNKTHSMKVIGYRKEGRMTLFLLQNWWKGKQFVEVSEKYLEECGSTIYYVKTPQKNPPNFSRDRADTVLAECCDSYDKMPSNEK